MDTVQLTVSFGTSPVKRCGRCHEPFPATTAYFYRSKTGRYHLSSECKPCRSLSNKQYRVTHKTSIALAMHAWYMAHHEEQCAYHAQYRATHKEERRHAMHVWYWAHREEQRARMQAYGILHRARLNANIRAYYATRREKQRAYTRAYKLAHPEWVRAMSKRRQARIRGAKHVDLTLEQWREIQAAFHYRCAYCGKKTRRLEMDHITALATGGNHTPANIVPACRTCNAQKYTNPPPVPVQPLLLTIAMPLAAKWGTK